MHIPALIDVDGLFFKIKKNKLIERFGTCKFIHIFKYNRHFTSLQAAYEHTVLHYADVKIFLRNMNRINGPMKCHWYVKLYESGCHGEYIESTGLCSSKHFSSTVNSPYSANSNIRDSCHIGYCPLSASQVRVYTYMYQIREKYLLSLVGYNI